MSATAYQTGSANADHALPQSQPAVYGNNTNENPLQPNHPNTHHVQHSTNPSVADTHNHHGYTQQGTVSSEPAGEGLNSGLPISHKAGHMVGSAVGKVATLLHPDAGRSAPMASTTDAYGNPVPKQSSGMLDSAKVHLNHAVNGAKQGYNSQGQRIAASGESSSAAIHPHRAPMAGPAMGAHMASPR